jgi:pimeloyl-ACP methyl ester carboxylesterase
MRKIGEVIGGRLFPLEEQGELRQGFVDRWAENHKPSYMAATRALAGWSVMEHVRAIQTPTLVLAADQDYTPVEMKEAYVRQMQDARLEVIRDARHAVNFAQPEKVNPLIEAFLKEGQR